MTIKQKRHECHDKYYMSASNINLTLQATFQFIKENQISKQGNLTKTVISTSIALLENQGTLINTPRNVTGTFIVGTINEASENYVVVFCEIQCPNEGIKYEEYTIQYDTIKHISNDILYQYYDEYLETMNKLPLIEKDLTNRNYVLLKELEIELEINENNPSSKLNVIYNGLSSLEYSPSNFYIIKNLLLINKSSIIPITYINGFFWRNAIC